MGSDNLDLQKYIDQAEGREPIEPDPSTNFHPDQLTAYPLARVGPELYHSQFEALIPGSDKDIFYVNAKEMDEYFKFGVYPEDAFDEVPISYSVMNSEIPFRGEATMVITDFEDLEYIEQFKARNEDARIPNTILLRSQENASELKTSELESIRRKLDGEDVMIKLRPTV